MTTIDTVDVSRAEGVVRGVSRQARQATLLIDGDIHPSYSVEDIKPYLDQATYDRVKEFGLHAHAESYPRVRNGGGRLDSRAVDQEGTPLAMFQRQLLDEYKERVGILIPMGGHHWGRERDDLAGPMCSALNEFMVHEWLDLEPRFFCTLQVPMEHPKAAVAEIERYRNDKRFVQILMSGHQEAEIGDQKYWPIYEAAADAGLPLGVHHGNDPRGRHGTGYPSYYTHEHIGYAYTLTALALSMITEGVFEEFPKLQVVSIEAGISWATGLQWEMDTTYEMLGREQPRLQARPSEYFRNHFWFTTQPIEEPDNPDDLMESYKLTGVLDRIMFSSDYPHWDFDAPDRSLPTSLTKEQREAILGENACRCYGIDPLTGTRL
jgi:predicted TIM-barrel fold metal-dependent hydrolase